ncbi:RNA polymerase sigma-70 factor, sigma-E family [Nocardioides exalbidus]|uniref:RNA polymerase sigma-70 factor, sigma-E family n=1 Tax=Nocardioides exalbidus TaxID=402596 RepID=A0A1H4NYB9_9ACTN|nr:SigE family RNA polymerase sigma factor [Nocardioides exalbidus]SEB99652.1 RNA polymerase sigma-70 factor, sigma-E family [Nocardioides exalbidus]
MRRNDREAEFVEFVAARRPYLRRAAYMMCGNWDQADDLVQQTLAKLYVAWPRVRRDGREEAYARQILLRVNIDEFRRGRNRERAASDQMPDRPAPDDFPVEERSALMDALDQLPTTQRKCVLCRHWLGLSVPETAAELGIPEGTVKSYTSRGLARLQELLADDQEPEPVGFSTIF